MFLAPNPVDVSYTTLATLTVCPLTPVPDRVKKPKRIRTSYTETQIKEFEKIFVINHYPSRKLMDKLSDTLDIPVERMRTWFQNRRSREKKVRQRKISKHPPASTYHLPDSFSEDMDSSINCLGGTAMADLGGADEMNQWLHAHTTHTPTTNQACMDCDSQTVYSSLYHHPVMTPGVVTTSRSRQLDNHLRSSNRNSYFGSQPCYGNQSCMQLAIPTAMGYSFQQPISCPPSPQSGMNLPLNNQGNIDIGASIAGPMSGQQVGGYDIDKSHSAYNVHTHAVNRNIHSANNELMYSVSASNSSSVFTDNDFNAENNNINPMYNLLVNVGQLQLSSYRMQVNANATLFEQRCGDMDNDVHQQGSRCQSADENSFGTPPMYYNNPMESQHMVHTACYTPPPPSTELPESHSNVYPWQVTPSRDLRSWNYNSLMFRSQSSPVGFLQIPNEGNFNRCRKAMSSSRSNFGFRQDFRPDREMNLNFIQANNNYVSHSARSTDDDTGSTMNSQDSDNESLESFGSIQCIPQIDMTASLLSELSPYGPVSPESFRGDTPHPDL